MAAELPPTRLARLRLAAQRLTVASQTGSAVEAAQAVVGIQAQDVRASRLALRSRVPGLERADVDGDSGLVRTWTVRGTVHLIAATDLPWLHELTCARNLRFYENLIERRGNLGAAQAVLPAMVEVLADDAPLTRAQLLQRLAVRGLPSLGPRSVNVLMPWACASGRVIGLPDGSFRPTDPPPSVDRDEALATLGRRYLAGYGPANPEDLARWSGLPITACRRALEACGELERVGTLLALPGSLDRPDPEPVAAQLLAAFDTALLGWTSREPLVPAAHHKRVVPGGGIIRAAVLAWGRAVGTWRLDGSGEKRTLDLDRFGRGPAAAALLEEVGDVSRFLGVEIRLPA